jgi:hypothetical protein
MLNLGKNESMVEAHYIPPAFHDARLTGLVLLPKQRWILLLATEDGKDHSVVLFGVERLRASDFREGNIILDLSVRGGGAVAKEEVLFTLGLDDEKNHLKFVDSIMSRIGRGELFLLQVNPSYGCVFSCLCASWLVDPTPGYIQLAGT